MNSKNKRSSLLCPNCNRLVGRDVAQCPYCGLKNPGSLLKDNPLTRVMTTEYGILRLILVVNIAMFIISVVIDPRSMGLSSSPFSFLSPSNNSLFVLGSTGTVPLFGYHRWWTLISSNFLHGSLLHIVFNMIALHQLGPLLIHEFGRNRMLAIYILSGVGGGMISAVFGVYFTIGASASICGLVGAALYYGKSRGGNYGHEIYRQIGGWALGIFIFGFLVPGINNYGHGGGMLVGALTAFVLGYRERAPERLWHRFLSMTCMAVTGLVLFWSLINGLFFLLSR